MALETSDKVDNLSLSTSSKTFSTTQNDDGTNDANTLISTVYALSPRNVIISYQNLSNFYQKRINKKKKLIDIYEASKQLSLLV